jgi:catechol 2,3-dioxygenase-like lactoylglutathione lyase family enzyme
MTLKNIVGLDHVVVVVRDLDAAAKTWENLGFTVSPRGTHSEHMGTGNYTMMFGEDYLELLGVLTPTERNAPTRALLEKREGIERAAFTTLDAAAGVAELQARGIAATGPIDFSRPVDLPDGRKTDAKFQTFLWPLDQKPAGMRIFACQHYTRDAVWIPYLQKHRNTVQRIIQVMLVSKEPKAAAEQMGRLIERPVTTEADGTFLVESGGSRGVFVFLDRVTLEKRYVGVPLAHLPDDGAVALVLQVGDLAAAKVAVAPAGGVVKPNCVVVPPAAANGVMLVLQV